MDMFGMFGMLGMVFGIIGFAFGITALDKVKALEKKLEEKDALAS